jgi:glycosyltransferase involved in cell wall biosynthesis
VLERQGPTDIQALARLARLCRERHIDLIHCHDNNSQLAAAVVRLTMPNLKVVMTFHRSLAIDTAGRHNRLRNSLAGVLTHAVITASKERREHYCQTTHIDSTKVVRIPLGIETSRFYPDSVHRADLRKELGLAPEVALLGAVGHFGQEKGLDVVIRAFQEVCRRREPGSAALVILGEGTAAQQAALRELYPKDGCGRVIFAGFQHDPERWFRAMDIFAHGARLEAFGLVLIEAMASGLPTIATRVGGIPDIVRDGQTGILVPPEDSLRMADALEVLLASQERRAAMGAEARRVVLQEYTGEVCARRHVQLYRELLAGRAPRGVDQGLGPSPRVLHVVESLEVGGLERLVADLVVLRGVETTSVACLETVGAFGEMLRQQGVEVKLIGIQSGILSTFRVLANHVRAVGPQIIHCHNMKAHLYGGACARLAGEIPVVLTKHGNSPPGTGKTGPANRWLARRTQVIAVSEDVKESMSKWIGNGRYAVRYIPNGISLEPFHGLPNRAAARAHFQWSQEEFLIGIVARLASSKGHRCLLQAFALFRRDRPSARLLIVGDGVMRETIRTLASDLGIADAVSLLGERPDVPVILAALDLFVLPSEHEGMPVTVLEAMAAGLPVVASTVGGIPQVVVNGQTGILIPPRDPARLAQVMLELAGDPESRQRMGERGRSRVAERFAMERMALAYEEVYEILLQEP